MKAGDMHEPDKLKGVIERIAKLDPSQIAHEYTTREVAVLPVIGALGWNIDDPEEVKREHSVHEGHGSGRVDYCLRHRKNSLVLIEVKHAGRDLGKHQEQLLRYAFEEGAKLAVLTNGIDWWLYVPGGPGRWEERCFKQINLKQTRDLDAVSSYLHRFLGHKNVTSGAAPREAEEEIERQRGERHAHASLQEAWDQILKDPDPNGILRELLKEETKRLSGHRPSSESVDAFLKGVLESATPSIQPKISAGIDTTNNVGGKRSPRKAGPRPIAFTLGTKREKVGNWRELMVKACELAARKVGSKFEGAVLQIRGSELSYFSLSEKNLRVALPISGTRLYVEGNLDASKIERVTREMLRKVLGSDRDFRIEIEEPGSDHHRFLQPSTPVTQQETSTGSGTTTETRPKRAPRKAGPRPVAFTLGTEPKKEVKSWRDLMVKVLEMAAMKVGYRFEEAALPIRSSKRSYFSLSQDKLNSGLAIKGTRLYVEGTLNSEQIESITREVLRRTLGTDHDLRIEIEEPGSDRRRFLKPSTPVTQLQTDTDGGTTIGSGWRKSPRKGTRPIAFTLGAERKEVSSWRDLMTKVCELAANKAGDEFERAALSISRFSLSRENLHTALPITGTRLYVEGNLDANRIERVTREMLRRVLGSDHDFQIEMEESDTIR